MVFYAVEYLKQKAPTLVYQCSCREGLCGSDGMNINGKSWLVCIKRPV
ncbi:2Fe-2S iron-sulfur cluster-binding protein [Alishewanella longhuensis]|nr:2Fe-2S iron-sulfur cluster-binding protein [Alishewanella longhuensis]